ncbi:Peroxisome chaperone and import receptor, partial [Cladochytrium tenue]
YPDWLRDNGDKLSSQDRERYQKQSEVIAEIARVFEAKLPEKEEAKQVVELMQKMQEYGNPPEELLKELSPGMETGPDGLPKLPGGGSDMPECPVM